MEGSRSAVRRCGLRSAPIPPSASCTTERVRPCSSGSAANYARPVATLFITCGVPGSGKTTLAKRLEAAHGALRLTGDEWLHELYPTEADDTLDSQLPVVARL